MFEKILVCLDGSKSGEGILPYVEAQALKFGSKVTLLQVVNLTSADFAGVTSRTPADESQMVAKQIERVMGEAKKYLDDIDKRVKARGIEVDSVVLNSESVDTAIVHYAEKNNIELIAITSHGHGGWKDFLFGSTADSILRKSSLPVLMIKGGKD